MDKDKIVNKIRSRLVYILNMNTNPHLERTYKIKDVEWNDDGLKMKMIKGSGMDFVDTITYNISCDKEQIEELSGEKYEKII